MDPSFPGGLWRSVLAVPIWELEDGIRKVLGFASRSAGADAAILETYGIPDLRVGTYAWTESGPTVLLAEEDPDVLVVRSELANNVGGRLLLRRKGAPSLSVDETAALEQATEILVIGMVRLKSELAVRESEERFRALAEHATELIAELDEQGCYLYVSPSFGELLGYEPDSLIGKPARSILHPDDLPIARKTLGEAFKKGGTSRSIHRLKHADGSWRWFDNSGRSYRRADGEARFVSIGRDVTERLETERELRESHAQLVQAQKLEAVGRLAGGIAHDFNNLLTVICGNAEVLAPRLHAAGLPDEEVEEILLATDRAAALTRQLMTFSRPHLAERRPVDLHELVQGVEPMLRRLMDVAFELQIETDPELEPIIADPNQVEQVVLNLALNARDAMPGGGRMRIETRRAEIDQKEARRLGLEGAGWFVLLSVRDEGTGIDDDTIGRIFEPFFTTKDPGMGTGLGLSIVYRVARQMDGAVDVESRPGRGSAFHVYFPVADALEEHGDLEPLEVLGGDETVLVVDDEPGSGRLIVSMLEDAGYNAIRADDANDALARVRATGGAIDLLITDVVMPGMRGPELAYQIQLRYPSVRVLLASGNADELEAALERLSGKAVFLRKPFRRRTLLTQVRSALDAPRS